MKTFTAKTPLNLSLLSFLNITFHAAVEHFSCVFVSFLPPSSLTSFRTNQQIQTKAMALLMALLQTAGDSDRKVLLASVSYFLTHFSSTSSSHSYQTSKHAERRVFSFFQGLLECLLLPDNGACSCKSVCTVHTLTLSMIFHFSQPNSLLWRIHSMMGSFYIPGWVWHACGLGWRGVIYISRPLLYVRVRVLQAPLLPTAGNDPSISLCLVISAFLQTVEAFSPSVLFLLLSHCTDTVPSFSPPFPFSQTLFVAHSHTHTSSLLQ